MAGDDVVFVFFCRLDGLFVEFGHALLAALGSCLFGLLLLGDVNLACAAIRGQAPAPVRCRISDMLSLERVKSAERLAVEQATV